MEEFDQIITENFEAEQQAKKEAWNFYKQNYMPQKAFDDGFYLGNEIYYYRSFIQQVLENQQLFANAKIASKKINKLLQKLEIIEQQKDLDRQKEMRHDFQLILQLLKIEFKSDQKEEIFQLIFKIQKLKKKFFQQINFQKTKI